MHSNLQFQQPNCDFSKISHRWILVETTGKGANHLNISLPPSELYLGMKGMNLEKYINNVEELETTRSRLQLFKYELIKTTNNKNKRMFFCFYSCYLL